MSTNCTLDRTYQSRRHRSYPLPSFVDSSRCHRPTFRKHIHSINDQIAAMAVATKRKAETESPGAMPQTPTKIQKTSTYPANTSVKRTPGARRRADLTGIPFPATEDMQPQLERIAASDKTPFQKRVLALLCQVPRGRVTTYGLMSRHLGSSPRAIGNAMRRNPFAPEVPCHRVVATGGALGGFKGEWPKNGEGITLDEKKVLLRREGVKFDGKGKVVGTPFDGFTGKRDLE